jgi:hypothetical protein
MGRPGGHLRLPGPFFGARGSGAYTFPNGFGIQTDLTYRRDVTDRRVEEGFPGPSPEEFDGRAFALSHADGTLHLFWRNPERFLVGVIGQFGQTVESFPASPGIALTFDRY